MKRERRKQELNISSPKAEARIRGKIRILRTALMVLLIIIFMMGSALAVFSPNEPMKREGAMESTKPIAKQQTSKAITEEPKMASYYKATIKEEKISDNKKKVIITNTYDGPIISGQKQVTTEKNKSYVVEGEEIEYTIIARNDGGVTKDVIIKDPLPEGLEFVESSIKVNGETIHSSRNNAETLGEGITVNVDAHSETKLTFKAKVKALKGDDVVNLEKIIKNIATVDEQKTEVTIKVKRENYEITDTSLIIKYLEKGSNKELAKQELQTGKVEEEYITEAKQIEGYTLVGDSRNTTGTLTIEPTTVIFYYLQNTKVTVNHIDKNTGELLGKVETSGLVGDEYTSTSKSFDRYILLEKPEEESVTMTKDEIILNYYYVQISAEVIEKHIDIITGEILDNKVHKGNVGDSYNIPAKEFEGYEVVKEKLPQNSKGIMTANETEVVYYYIYKSNETTEVIERHIDIKTGKQLLPEEKFEGYEGDEYKTKPENIPYYDLVKEKYPENSEGKMTIKQIVVNYYYIGQAKVVVNHIDIDTNKKLSDEKIIEGYEEDRYIAEPKDIKYYKLVEDKLPENSEGTMSIETTVDENGNRIVNNTTYINYYYKKLDFNLSIDNKINNIIINGRALNINGKLGKVEIAKNEATSSKIEISYIIRVTNKGKITGKAKLLENIPTGTVMNKTNNPLWEIGEETATLETDKIKPGETKVYEVILEWKNGNNNIGSKVNEVEILSGQNEPGFEDSNKDDNKDTAEVIITLNTGGKKYVAIAGIALVILVGVVVVLVKKKKDKI